VRRAHQRPECVLQLVEGDAWKTDHLATVGDQVECSNPNCTNNNDVPIVVNAMRGRAPGKTGIGSLKDDYFVGGNASSEHSPLLDEVSRPHDRQRRPLSKAETSPVPPCPLLINEYVARTYDGREPFDQLRIVFTGSYLCCPHEVFTPVMPAQVRLYDCCKCESRGLKDQPQESGCCVDDTYALLVKRPCALVLGYTLCNVELRIHACRTPKAAVIKYRPSQRSHKHADYKVGGGKC